MKSLTNCIFSFFLFPSEKLSDGFVVQPKNRPFSFKTRAVTFRYTTLNFQGTLPLWFDEEKQYIDEVRLQEVANSVSPINETEADFEDDYYMQQLATATEDPTLQEARTENEFQRECMDKFLNPQTHKQRVGNQSGHFLPVPKAQKIPSFTQVLIDIFPKKHNVRCMACTKDFRHAQTMKNHLYLVHRYPQKDNYLDITSFKYISKS